MYTFLEDFEANNVAVYNIGQPDGTIATSWGIAPSAIIQVNSLMLNGNSQIASDNNGGIWVSQRRSKGQNLATTPSLIHVDAAGSINFNSGNNLTDLNGSPQAGFAVSRDGTILAIGDGDLFTVLLVAHVAHTQGVVSCRYAVYQEETVQVGGATVARAVEHHVGIGYGLAVALVEQGAAHSPLSI